MHKDNLSSNVLHRNFNFPSNFCLTTAVSDDLCPLYLLSLYLTYGYFHFPQLIHGDDFSVNFNASHPVAVSTRPHYITLKKSRGPSAPVSFIDRLGSGLLTFSLNRGIFVQQLD